ncbi:DNA adenine methylase [Vogesella urethralis]|uniref:DNA adenine methylase n=1 Tax=Vogesella urethralis TaxID=2592656 RepID=UPI0011867536|nr:DNA adenine methylase [Vogesella urethralis]
MSTISEKIDTSSIYNELCKNYHSTGAAVEVDFRGMISWLKKGDQLTHQIHTYPAKLLPHIAHFFTRASSFFDESNVVLDPFCGSGTVALEASLAGCQPLVADANPFALMLTKVKTRNYDVSKLRSQLEIVIKKSRRYKQSAQIEIVNPELWYSEKNKTALERILRAIRTVEPIEYQEFFLICFSVLAKRMSYADPHISVPVRLREKDKFSAEVNRRIRERLAWIDSTLVSDEFLKICQSNIERINAANECMPSRKEAMQAGVDARLLTSPQDAGVALGNNSVPLIVTSPPYGSAQKYIRASSLSLNWLGLTEPCRLSELEGKSIGREHVPAFRENFEDEDLLPENFRILIKKISSINETRARITQKYLVEMDRAIAEMVRVISPNGCAAIVIGNNQVCGQVLRNDNFLIERFAAHGMGLELNLIDDIKSRGLMTKRNRTASIISRESVLVFRKKG